MWDHDAAPIALFENSHLVTLAKSTVLPFRHEINHIGALPITEPHSRANAGIVWFPRMARCPEFSSVYEKADQLKEQLLRVADHNALTELTLKAEITRMQDFFELCARKQPPHFKVNDSHDPYGFQQTTSDMMVAGAGGVATSTSPALSSKEVRTLKQNMQSGITHHFIDRKQQAGMTCFKLGQHLVLSSMQPASHH